MKGLDNKELLALVAHEYEVLAVQAKKTADVVGYYPREFAKHTNRQMRATIERVRVLLESK